MLPPKERYNSQEKLISSVKGYRQRKNPLDNLRRTGLSGQQKYGAITRSEDMADNGSSKCRGNTIKITLDNSDGPAVGYVKVPNTGSTNKVEAVTVKIKKITGVHNLFFVFAGKGFQFDSWKFKQ